MEQNGNGPAPNALQALIREHMAATGDTIADIAARGGLPRQTVSNMLNRTDWGGIPHRRTMRALATGLGVSLAVVHDAAAHVAAGTPQDPLEGRLALLMDTAKGLQDEDVAVLLATARAMQRRGPTRREGVTNAPERV